MKKLFKRARTPPLLALPLELRMMIFKYVQASELKLPNLLEYHHVSALVQVCRQTRCEYLWLLQDHFSRTCFRIPLRFIEGPPTLFMPWVDFEMQDIIQHEELGDYWEDVYYPIAPKTIEVPNWLKMVGHDMPLFNVIKLYLAEGSRPKWHVDLVLYYYTGTLYSLWSCTEVPTNDKVRVE